MPKKLTHDEVIYRIKQIWGDKFDLSRVIYMNSQTPIELICDKGHVFRPTLSNLLRKHGCFLCAKEKQKKPVFGIGINDLQSESKTKAYSAWIGMIERCYSQKLHLKEPSYKNCSVCEDWLTFSNFKQWFENPTNGYQNGYQLDKDLMVKGNKVYSPDTCCFLPRELNNMLIMQQSKRTSLPAGVCIRKNKFQARFGDGHRRKHLGLFSTPEEAFLAYKKAKEQYVKELSEKYYKEGRITERVYNALLNYMVEITD